MYTAVIILNFNNSEDTINCISSILKYNDSPIRIVVVDNGSRDEEEKKLERYFNTHFKDDFRLLRDGENVEIHSLPYVTLVASDTNDGYARGNNKGLEIAYKDDSIRDLLILNNDILLIENIIPRLKEIYYHAENCGVVSPLLYARDGSSVEYNCARKNPKDSDVILRFLFHNRNILNILGKKSDGLKLLKNNPKLMDLEYFPVDLTSGSCMFISKNLMKSLGGFDEGTFLYYEENILYKKLSALGLVNYCAPCVHAIHLGGSSTGKVHNAFLWRCNFESAGYYLEKYCNLSFLQKVLWKLIGWTMPKDRVE